MDAFDKNNQLTTDRWLTVFAIYLGYRLVRVETAALGNPNKYTVACPELDWVQVQREFADPETPILRRAFCMTIDRLQGYVNHARKNGNVWSCFGKHEN